MARAPEYHLIDDYGVDHSSITTAPGWVVAVVRLGKPLSYSRKDRKSVSTDVSSGARLRGPTIIIASDCFSLSINGSKDSHLKTLVAELKQTDHNYLVEILPGDWVLAWILNYQDDVATLIKKIKNEEACNGVDDGFKFIGRVESIRKRISLDRNSGMRTSSITLAASGFKELDSSFFYDPLLSQHDESLGTWLTRIGVSVSAIFDVDNKGGQKNNSSAIIKTLLQLLLGKGVDSPKVNAASKQFTKNGGDPNALQAGAGAGQIAGGEQAPYAYIIPRVVGKLLGCEANEAANKPGGVLAFSDILEVSIGVQSYEDNNAEELGKRFSPKLKELLGTYLPVTPNFTNMPLWSLLQQFLNAHVNEVYTAYRISAGGRVLPTIVARQIPSTDAFKQPEQTVLGPQEVGGKQETLAIAITKHLDLPRWILHPTMVNNVDIGRSDATRFNFVHIYGQDANLAETVTFTQQLVSNPPIRDDLDIQRSGLRPYLASVACSIRDQVGSTPSTWIALVADRFIGSQYTFNGSIGSIGIQAPIAEGDNLSFDGIVYQIESINHHCMIGPDGSRSFSTTLTLTNGLRSQEDSGGGNDTGESGTFPIYPGFDAEDNTDFDPGHSIDDSYDRTPPSVNKGDLDTGTDDDRKELRTTAPQTSTRESGNRSLKE